MQGDAQLAVIGVGLVGMRVRNLRHGQKRQQDQAHSCDDRQPVATAALAEGLCPFRQSDCLSLFHFIEERIELDVFGLEELYFGERRPIGGGNV